MNTRIPGAAFTAYGTTRGAEEHQSPSISRSTLSVGHGRSLQDLRDQLPAWERLYTVSGVNNPFVDPLWLMAWAEHYVGENDLDVIFVRSDGRLVGVAPFYRSRARLLGRLGPSRLLLLGSGGRDNLTELTELLVLKQQCRAILKTIVTDIAFSADCDWLEFAFAAQHGWLETQWLPMRGQHPRFVALHKGTTASVILELLGTSDGIPLKRNMRRNLRHRNNQLQRQGATIGIERLNRADQMEYGLQILSRLHRARSTMHGVPFHPDMLQVGRARAFLGDAVTSMAAAGRAAIFVLHIDRQPAAVQLVLIANGCYYMALSGLDPTRWHASPLTLLTAAVIDDAHACGANRVNLSTGPNTAKLSWSEHLEYHQEFLLFRRSVLASTRFAAYWQARSFERIWHEYRLQRRLAGP